MKALEQHAGVAAPERNVEIVDPVEDARWRAFAANAEGGTIFHHPSWLRLLRDQYRYSVRACCVTDGAGEVVAGLPLAELRSRLTGARLAALPFSDCCPPLAGDSSGVTRHALAAALAQHRAEVGLPLTIHGEVPELPDGHVIPRFHHHGLALDTDFAAVERGFSKSVRKSIKRAGKDDVRVERRTDREGLDLFYRLHMVTRSRLGVPTQPRGFIRRFSDLFAEGLGFVLLGHVRGELGAAAVFLTGGRTITYKYGASEPRLQKHCPNNLILSDAIQWGCENGFRTFDFGRTDLDNEGLRRFKRGWGADERALAYTYAPDAPEGSGDGPAVRMLAPVLRRSPPVVSRAVGEALYKHFG